MMQDPNYMMTLMVEAEQSEAMAGMIEAWKAQFRAKTNVGKEYERRWWRKREREREAIECDGVFAFESK